MSKQIEAMKLALEALEETERVYTEPAGYEGKYGKALDQAISKQQEKIDAARSDVLNAIAALREALAEQPAQQSAEPEIVQRVMRYAGQTMRTARNPNITARECIELADWIVSNTTPQPPAPVPEAHKPLTALVKAAQGVLEWTEISHRPPVRDRLECGRMVMVRLHALADLHDALTGHGITKGNT